MLINLIILAILAWAFMLGYHRGLMLQAIYSLGIIVSALIALQNYKPLANTISQWIPFSSATASSHLLFFSDNLLFHLDEAFYAGVAFLIIFVIVYVIIRLIGLFLKFTQEPFGKYGKIAAGVLALFATYFGLQMFFVIVSLVPMTTIQEHLNASFLVRLMVLHTPISSHLLQNIFIESITKINPIN